MTIHDISSKMMSNSTDLARLQAQNNDVKHQNASSIKYIATLKLSLNPAKSKVQSALRRAIARQIVSLVVRPYTNVYLSLLPYTHHFWLYTLYTFLLSVRCLLSQKPQKIEKPPCRNKKKALEKKILSRPPRIPSRFRASFLDTFPNINPVLVSGGKYACACTRRAVARCRRSRPCRRWARRP